MTSQSIRMDHVNFSVKNLKESVNWYHRIFGFDKVEEGVRNGRHWAILRKDDALLAVYEHPDLAFMDPDDLRGKGTHAISHFSFRIKDAEAWKETIRKENVPVALEWTYPHSHAWYVNDPTGYEIEVTCWNEDKVAFN